MNRKYIIILLILSAFLFLFKIGSIPMIDGDTAYYSVIARNIVKSGNWLTLTYNNPGQIIDKPPLCFWLIGLSIKFFGATDFAINFWHAILGILTILTTYLIGKELFDHKTGYMSGLILMTSALFFYQARVPLQDIPLVLFLSLAFYSFILFEKYKFYRYFYLIPIFMALSVLTKGPIGLILVGLVLFVYLLLSGRLFSYKATDYLLHFPLALLIFFLIAAPWFIYETMIFGQQFLQIHVLSYFGRFFHPGQTIYVGKDLVSANPQYDFYSYVLQLLVLMLPWSGFLYPAYFYLARDKTVPKTAKNFLLAWGLGILLFYSLSLDYKMGRYMLPALPAFALTIAYFWQCRLQALEKTKNYFRISWILSFCLIIPALIAATFWLMTTYNQEQAGFVPIFLPFISILTILLVSSFFIKKPQRSFTTLVASGLISFTVLLIALTIYFPDAYPIKKFALKAQELAQPNDKICQFMGGGAYAEFYLDRHISQVEGDKNLLNSLQARTKTYYLTNHPEHFDRFYKQNSAKITVIERKNGVILFSN